MATISQTSTAYPYTRRSQSQLVSRSLRLDSQIFSLDHEELSSYCLRGREADTSTGPVPASGAAALNTEEEASPMETVPPHLLQIRAMYSTRPTKTEVEGEESVPLGESATTPVNDMAMTAAEDLLQGQPDEEWDEEAMLKRELAKLHTGEDVIAFFAKNGSNSSVKFVYCKRKEHVDPTEFRPYDLEVISELMEGSTVSTAAKLGEHFTISATGVVHVCPDQQSEHMSLGDWMHQCLMYNVLTSMNFFKYYIHGKVFGRWKQHSRFTTYCHARKLLVRRLFLSKPLFVNPLVKIQSLMHEVESVKVLNIGSNTYDLANFEKEQAMVRSSTGATGTQKELEELHNQIVAALDKLVTAVSQSTEPQSQELQPGRPRMKSMVQEKKEASDNARRHRLAVHDKKMLGDCVRLVDYMFQACLAKVVINAAVEFFQRVDSSSKMFSISVAFGEKNMVFDPCLEDFIEMLFKLWRASVQVVNGIPSLLSEAHYAKHLTHAVANSQTVESILNNNWQFNHYTAAVRERIQADINTAQKFSDKHFEMFRRIHDYGNNWDEKAYVAAASAQDLASEMSLMRDFQSDLDKYKQHHHVGIIMINGSNLRESLQPVPKEGLTAMKRGLEDIARKKCEVVKRRFDQANKALDVRPTSLTAFADYIKAFNEIKNLEPELEEAREEVESMYQLLRQYNVRVGGTELENLEFLQAKGSEFAERKLNEADAYIREKQDEQVENLNAVSQMAEEDAKKIVEQLRSGCFVTLGHLQTPEVVMEELGAIQALVSKLEEKALNYNEYQVLLYVPVPFEFAEVDKAKQLFAEKLKLWTLASDWKDQYDTWKRDDIWRKDEHSKFNVEEMNKKVLEFSKTAYQLTRSLEGDKVAQDIRTQIDEVKSNMPCIMDLGNPALRDRHHAKIKQEIEWKHPSSQQVTLNSLMSHKVFDKKEFISEISGIASGEFALEQQLQKVVDAWADLLLPIQQHRREQWILGDVSDIITQLEDHSVQIQTMMGSRFVRDIRHSVEIWEQKIRLASDTLDEWLQVQRAWIYLESIFSAEDIQRQLPAESAKFKTVDKMWKDWFKKVRQSYHKAMEALHIPKLLEGLRSANETLDQIQKSLEAYLETKRAAFPRFYFLSDDELLSIMSQTRNPEAVQEHLCKCFDAISFVTFTEEKKKDIIDMNDMIKEKVPFTTPVQTSGSPVEKWLGDIEQRMVESLHAVTKAAVGAYPEDGIIRKDWLFGPFPAQSALAVDQIMWTSCAEEALNQVEAGDAEAMKRNIAFTNKQKEHSVDLVRLDLTKLQRVLMGALIVLDVHGISVLEQIEAAKCRSVNDFDWSKQLRYYWALEDVPMSDGTKASDTCIVKQTIANIRYSFEYLGNTPRLVVTPLTDKCYMTLTGAIHLNYGGAPAGPAGTGKTETTKDLGKALAVPVIVFNCSDGLDYKIMGRFFSGLAQAGAWACFDEFNRIQVEVLSVIAQQMLTVTHAIRARKETFEFVGREIPLNPRFGVFITMNPGYAGRAKLPDNLKSLFRPVAMMVPDYCLIAEIILYSEGFGRATALARKMVNLYSLSSEQLSKQDHYDFGMRAVKSVLVMAGQLKRKYPTLVEDVTLIRALRDSNVPKFLSFDLPLFFGIISDLYPDADVPYVDYGSLQKEIENQLRIAKLQVVPTFVGKIIQLLETQLVRHGVMVVGNAFIGKSTKIQVLAKALSKLRQDNSPDPAHQVTKTFSLNPKSITMEELYGFSNINTGEWTDGLVALLVREAVSDTSDNKKWVLFDGPVDAIWIENMNTVLDDNKMLCLANGERIKLPPTMTMMFEVQDLKVASPATISRCGMVYLEPVHLGWKPLVQSWAENFKKKFPAHSESLKKWVIDICDKALPFLREECREAPGIPSVDTNLVGSFLKMLTTFISPQHGFKLEEGGKGTENKQEKVLARIYCAFSAMWSLGANLHEASRKKFQEFLRNLLQTFCPEVLDQDLYSLCVNDKEGCFIPVSEIVPAFSFDVEVPFFNILVPTVETTMQRLLVENLMSAGYHVLFSGETGVGKSVGIQQFLGSAGDTFAVASANFSAQTSSANLVDFLENTLERKRKTLLGAPAGKTMLLFIDDINMPMLEKFGAQPPIELLRQVVDYKGFYDRKKLFWKGVQETQFIAACGPPGGGRMPVTPRLLRHFNMIWMTALPQDTMHRILSSILGGWLGVKKPSLQDRADKVVSASVEMFFRTIADLLPTPVKCHYTFNLRDPAKMLQGMLMVNVRTELSDAESLTRLWVHETCRQFRDRLVNKEDRSWFDNCLAENLEKHLQITWPVESFADLMYGDFFDRNEKPYMRATDPAKTQLMFEEALEEYNSMNPSKMNLVFFKDAQEHLARSARIIRQPRGNALLVGVSGVGRKSMARMAAHMAEFNCSSIEITRTYGVNDFREDLKRMMTEVTKGEGKGMAFLFSDTQIVKETFLEDINNILNTCEVPNLFAPDEVEQVIGLTRPLAKAAGKVDARDIIWQHFVQVVREGFHIILAFSPVGEGFRARCRQFPSLINCATVDWYDPWPQDALVSVAERYYKEAPKELELDAQIPALSQISCVIHASSSEAAERFFDELRRKTYMTPTSYLELIKLFTDLLGMKKGELDMKLNRYKVGAQRLKETETVVDKLKVDLTKLQPVIEQGKKDTAALIVQVDREEAVAKEAQASCEVDEKEAMEAAATATAIKNDCQKELDEALPEYYNAIKALDSLDKKDIQEVKSFAKPPPLVETVLSAVCLLMNRKESWDEAKKLMNDTGFLQSLKDYDKDALAGNVKLTQKLQKYVKRDDFQPDQVKKVYARVARSIEPKKEKLKEAEDANAAAEAKLDAKKKELKAVQDNVAGLQLQLARARSKAEKLEQDAETCKVQLGRAEKLLAGLGNESVRWDAASKILEKNIKFVMGDIALAAGFIAYAGPFTAEFRARLISHWLTNAQEVNLTADPNWKCSNILCEPAEIREWNIKSLPTDDLSVENGLLVTRGRRWPLMIDPQGQGNRWIRNMKKDTGLGIIKLSTPNFLRTVENCIREGNAVLLENVEEVLDPSLEPVLLKQVFKKGGQFLLRLGSEDVPYNEDFRFFVTTKMANPHYLPEICIKVTVINFTVTLLGLEDQLVADVVKNERPDLAELRANLVVQIAADKAEMDRLEQLILKLLSEAGDDLLADDTLIVTLDQSKKTGDSCKERMASAEESMKEIDEVTEVLRPCATRASIIYFVVADLANIDPMYQYSLQFFASLFEQRLAASARSDDPQERIQIIIKDFTEFIYTKICMGLFEDHKLLFAFMVCNRCLRHKVHAQFMGKQHITDEEWSFFLRGVEAGKGVVEESIESDCPKWMNAGTFKKLQVLERLTMKGGNKAFEGLTAEMFTPQWEDFGMDDNMTNRKMPGEWGSKLTAFQQLLIIKALRENFLQLVVRHVVEAEMGSHYIVSPPFDLVGCFKDSKKTMPLIFVLSAGADPTDYLVKLARDFEYEERLHFISLGQGQGQKAENLIQMGRESGDWVCLQNCHLAASWMPTLERIQEMQDPDQIDDMYRLWLTSMPSPSFPVPVLQGGIKITNEPPKGLRANLSRTFQDISTEIYEGCSKSREYKKLLYALAFFHAAILERRKFGPIGWNVPYEWMDSDFQVSREQVAMYLESQPGVPWITLKYIIAEVNYGGRVTDDKDVRLISAFLKRYFNEGVLEDGYKLSPLDAYTCPNEGSLEEVREHVRKLPMDEDPQVFGLHPNAQITAQTEAARQFLGIILSVQPRIASGAAIRPEDLVAQMAEAFLGRVPKVMNRKEADPETYKKTPEGGIVSLGVFHGQEMDRFNVLIQCVQSTLVTLGRAIKGFVVMSAQLEDMYNAFLLQKLPPNWGEVAYPCLKPLNSWFTDFEERIAFMARWLHKGPPVSFWVPCFYFPQGFMTCAKQVHARKTKIPIDDLVFWQEPTNGTDPMGCKRPEDGVNVHGFFLQGAGWDVETVKMVESEKAVLFKELPITWIQVVEEAVYSNVSKQPGRYTCPLYKTSLRKGTLATTGHSTNFVCYFHLPSDVEDQGHWVRRGVALLCMLDD